MISLLRGDGLALIRGGRLLFEGLDIELGEGEALHLTGPNGCGKSSLIRLVAGLLRPSSGRIERADAALADEARRAKVGSGLDPDTQLGPIQNREQYDRVVGILDVEPILDGLNRGHAAQHLEWHLDGAL